MAESTRAAASLIVALAEAGDHFRRAAYSIFLTYGVDVSWQQFSTYGGTDDRRSTIVGCLIDLKDGREVEAAVTITVGAGLDEFMVEGDVTIQDGWAENNTDWLELPEAVVSTVPECVGKLRDYVEQLTHELPGLVDELKAVPPPHRAHP